MSETDDPYMKLKFKIKNRNEFKSPWEIFEVQTTFEEEQKIFMNDVAPQIKQLFNKNKTARTLSDALKKAPVLSQTNYPISLKLIYDRAKNGWYKNTFQIYEDTQQLSDVGLILNMNHQVVQGIVSSINQIIVSCFEDYPLPNAIKK